MASVAPFNTTSAFTPPPVNTCSPTMHKKFCQTSLTNASESLKTLSTFWVDGRNN